MSTGYEKDVKAEDGLGVVVVGLRDEKEVMVVEKTGDCNPYACSVEAVAAEVVAVVAAICSQGNREPLVSDHTLAARSLC